MFPFDHHLQCISKCYRLMTQDKKELGDLWC